MNRLGPASAALALSLLMCGMPAQARIYKWVDDGGVTHYSQEPPPDGGAQIINTHAAPPSTASGNGATGSADAGKPAKGKNGDKGTSNSGHAQSMADYCKNLRNQSQMLASDRRIKVKQDDGTLTPLTGDARKKRQAKVESQIAQYCSD